MLKCNYCGKVVDEDELGVCSEGVFNNYGEYMGSKYYQAECSCGGEFVEADECELCGEWFLDDELTNGFCDDCLESEMTFENAEKFGAEENCLNYFYECVLGIDKINEILGKYLREYNVASDETKATSFCKEDKYAFAEWLGAEYANLHKRKN